jgi:hypothetical protein
MVNAVEEAIVEGRDAIQNLRAGAGAQGHSPELLASMGKDIRASPEEMPAFA